MMHDGGYDPVSQIVQDIAEHHGSRERIQVVLWIVRGQIGLGNDLTHWRIILIMIILQIEVIELM